MCVYYDNDPSWSLFSHTHYMPKLINIPDNVFVDKMTDIQPEKAARLTGRK